MGMYDTVDGIPEGYDDQVKLWDCTLETFGKGDDVPSVYGEETYSVLLHQVKEDKPPRYLHVVNNVLVETDKDTPLPDVPVFNKWGGSEEERSPVEEAMEEALAQALMKSVVISPAGFDGVELMAKPPKSLSNETWETLRRYVLQGISPGSGMLAVLQGDLFEVFARGDKEFLEQLEPLIKYLTQSCPQACFGDRERVSSWREQGGLQGMTKRN